MARIDIDSLRLPPTDAVSVDDFRTLALLVNDALNRIERLESRLNDLVDIWRSQQERRIDYPNSDPAWVRYIHK